jgi:hypothetical protein
MIKGKTSDDFQCLNIAQSPPFLTYTGGPKREALHLSIESSILGSLHGFNFFFLQWANQIGSLQKKNIVGLVRHPQLINMNQNNEYPQFMDGVP